jgi:hypothetical protein
MLYREKIAVCSEIHTKHINTLCGQNVEFVNVKPGGTHSNHWALSGLDIFDVVSQGQPMKRRLGVNTVAYGMWACLRKQRLWYTLLQYQTLLSQ